MRIFTDGSCLVTSGAGGWAIVIKGNGEDRELSGAVSNTTNNRMELQAALEALRTLEDGAKAVVHTDSNYVKQGVTLWMRDWKHRGWKRKSGSLKNLDLWQQIDKEAARLDVTWRWVRAHAGHPDNERADQLAQQAAKSVRSSKGTELESTETPQSSCSEEQVVVHGVVFGLRANSSSAWFLQSRDSEGSVRELGGASTDRTAYSLGLDLAIRSLEMAPSTARVELCLNCPHVAEGVNGWSHTWRRNGWRTSDGRAVAHREKWQALLAAVEGRQVDWRRVSRGVETRLKERARQHLSTVSGDQPESGA